VRRLRTRIRQALIAIVAATAATAGLAVPLARPAAAVEPTFRIGDNFGIQNGEIWSYGTAAATTVLDGMAATQAKWIRLGVSWEKVEPNPPVGGVHTYYYNRAPNPADSDREWFDREIQGALDRGMKVLLVFNFTAPWAADTDCMAAGTGATHCPPASDATTQANWHAFVKTTVARYKNFTLSNGSTGHVTNFEFLNEPNNSAWRVSDGAQLNGAIYGLQVLKEGSAAVHEVTPPSGSTWTIVSAGLDSHLDAAAPNAQHPNEYYETPPYFMAQLWFVDTTGATFDVIGVHPYIYGATDPNDGMGMTYADTIFNDAANRGTPKSLWATEFGICTSATSACGDVDDAVNQLPGYMEAWMSKFYSGPAFLYAYQDSTGNTPAEDSFGLVHNDLSQKTATNGVTYFNVYLFVNSLPLPTVSVGNFTVGESNSGDPVVSFNAVLSHPMTAGTTATIIWGTTNGSATAGSDYNSPTGLASFLIFGPGQTTATGHVTLLSDTADEGNETFHVNLMGTNAAARLSTAGDSATGTIVDDDPTAPAVKAGNARSFEGNSGNRNLVFNVNLPAPVCAGCSAVTYHVLTQDGTALAGSDYTAVDTTITFNPGDVVKTVSVPISGNTVVEANTTETFHLRVRNVGSNTNLASGTGTIANDD
jgi:hypothetical protein